ncbi:MAG: glycoside hydrolase family 13 protein [Butyrivibrio sp.]
MDFAAIHHDVNKRYCFALEKGRFLIRIKTRKGDMQRVVLHYRDKYLPVSKIDTRQQAVMKIAASDRYNDYYEAEISFDVICLRYFFEMTDKSGVTKYFGNYEFYDNPIDNNDRMFDCPQNLREEEIFQIPSWARNKVVYQIFPSRFASGTPVDEALWYKAPIGMFDNLHGDLRGIINHLDHIKELGIDIIYMTPIFRSDSTHKYDTIDYYQIDESFGTKEDLKELVDKAHAMGIRVILDAVFNHTSPKFFAFADIMKNEERSEYLNWYYIDSFPLVMEFGQKPNFKTFSYFFGMPKLNLRNPATEEYFLNVGRYWIKEIGIDGWRLDVGDEVTHRFWKKFREAVREVNPEALIIGEIWHYAGDFLEGDEWDTVMNYPFYLSTIDFIAEESITPTEFMGNMGFMRGNLHPECYNVLLNLIDSHDTPRFTHLCKNNKSKHRLAAAIQLLTPGMPMIYYGDEYGMQGGKDPDCRRGMLWDEKYQDRETYELYRRVIDIRKKHPCITLGEVIYDGTDDNKNLIVQTREKDGDKLTLIFHRGEDCVILDEFKGREDILSGKVFDGSVKGYTAIILK